MKKIYVLLLISGVHMMFAAPNKPNKTVAKKLFDNGSSQQEIQNELSNFFAQAFANISSNTSQAVTPQTVTTVAAAITAIQPANTLAPIIPAATQALPDIHAPVALAPMPTEVSDTIECMDVEEVISDMDVEEQETMDVE